MASKLSSPSECYPAQSLPLYILRVFAQFLPALLMPCSRRGKPRHVSLNACRFQKGEWESLWNQTLKHNNSELAHRAKKLAGNPPAPASIRARARYAEYCARKGALSKANQAMTSDMTPSAAPTNINELRATGPTNLATKSRHRYVVGGRRRARVHSEALQCQAHCQVFQDTLAGVRSRY
jgi:hypothetical protein